MYLKRWGDWSSGIWYSASATINCQWYERKILRASSKVHSYLTNCKLKSWSKYKLLLVNTRKCAWRLWTISPSELFWSKHMSTWHFHKVIWLDQVWAQCVGNYFHCFCAQLNRAVFAHGIGQTIGRAANTPSLTRVREWMSCNRSFSWKHGRFGCESFQLYSKEWSADRTL